MADNRPVNLYDTDLRALVVLVLTAVASRGPNGVIAATTVFVIGMTIVLAASGAVQSVLARNILALRDMLHTGRNSWKYRLARPVILLTFILLVTWVAV